MIQIDNINLTQVHTDELQGLLQQIAAQTPLVTVEADQAVINTFCTDTARFAEAMKPLAGNSFTEARKAADEVTDHLCVGIRKFADGNTYSPDAGIVATAKMLIKTIDKYGYFTKMSYKKQYPNVYSLINDLKAIPAAEVENMGLGIWITALDEAYNNFVALTDEKMTEESEKQVGIVQETRDAAQLSYYAMVSRLNMGAGYMGEEPYVPFINKVNAIIGEYKTELAARKTRATTKKGE